jgi:hypothetical protein
MEHNKFWWLRRPQDTNSRSVSCRYLLEWRKDSNDEFHILPNGTLLAPYLGLQLKPYEYCLDVFRQSNMEEEEVMPLVCFPDPPSNGSVSLPYILYPIGKRRRHRSTECNCPVISPQFCIREVSDSKLKSETCYPDGLFSCFFVVPQRWDNTWTLLISRTRYIV